MSEHPRGVRLFCPWRCHKTVLDVDPAELCGLGVQAVLLDVDNTLVGWQRRDIRKEVLTWVESLRQAGLKLYLVSNARHNQRLIDVAAEIGLPYVRRAWKPSKRGFLTALRELDVEPKHAVMIGDQLFTDIYGGNKLGIRTILVEPIAPKEFFGTRISRMVERFLLGHFRRTGSFDKNQTPSPLEVEQ